MMKQDLKPNMFRPLEMPDDRLTAVTKLKDHPYLHLKNSVVDQRIKKSYDLAMKETIKYRDPKSIQSKTHITPYVQVMNLEKSLMCIRFAKQELTHLDPHLLQDNHLQPELFLES